MEVYLNRMAGLDDAIVSMFLSKRTLTQELERDIRNTYMNLYDRDGFPISLQVVKEEDKEKMDKWTSSLFKWGWKHVTMLKFIDLSFTVYGLHRAGQDDWDAHAERFQNRIIRNSTRLADFSKGEMSDYYKGKIIPTDKALDFLGVRTPNTIRIDDDIFVRTTNGYIREDFAEDKDVKRGLYMLSIPSNFIFKVNLAEFSHIYKERNENSSANPEVKECCEKCAEQIMECLPLIDRDYLLKILC